MHARSHDFLRTIEEKFMIFLQTIEEKFMTFLQTIEEKVIFNY